MVAAVNLGRQALVRLRYPPRPWDIETSPGTISRGLTHALPADGLVTVAPAKGQESTTKGTARFSLDS